jgi:hypothetical protein
VCDTETPHKLLTCLSSFGSSLALNKLSVSLVSAFWNAVVSPEGGVWSVFSGDPTGTEDSAPHVLLDDE